ncbi:uncharacterized protein LOC110607913 [Manihot esculenta]|uniref:uncharacterized protein LOC110607913 n=1 Tax=Manihot esculenta TaxID=3983 RepID=UPI000B5D1FEF|nr:uncharacterized protein LOC110607913 [Manihot esculenta]
MEDDSSFNSIDLLLGRQFLSTARMKIDMREGTLTMEFDREEVKFDVYDAMKYSDGNFSLCSIDIVDPFAQEAFKLRKKDKLEVVVTKNLTLDSLDNSTSQLDEEIVETVRSLDTSSHNDIRSFLGHAGFYRRFIKDFSKVTQPFCKLLQKDALFNFDEKCQEAFDTLK